MPGPPLLEAISPTRFSMDVNNLNNDVVDSIISIAILNDKDYPARFWVKIPRRPRRPNSLTTEKSCGNRSSGDSVEPRLT